MKLRWDISELTINEIPEEYFDDIECKELIKRCRIEVEDGNACVRLYPSKTSIYIADNSRIESCDDLSEFLQYYSTKQDLMTVNQLFIPTDNKCAIEALEDYSDTNLIYRDMLSSVIIDIPSVNKSLMNFSPSILDEIRAKLEKYNKDLNNALNFIIQFLSLIPIADKVMYDEETKTFLFILTDFQKEKKSCIKLKWKEYEKVTNTFFYQCYLWITSDKNKGIDIDLKRNIVKNYLNNMENLDLITTLSSNDITDMFIHFDDILKMVIANRTKEYFDNKRMMKEEFVGLFTKSNEIYSDIVKRILSLIIVIAAGIYGVVFVNGQIFDWSKPNRDMSILFIVFMIGEVFVGSSFVADIVSFRNYKNKLKEIYGIQLLMNTNEWEKVMKTRSYIFPSLALALVIIGTLIVINHFW
ncbi:MAG: hypothetical protein AAGU76_04385 [Sedimentibacter sp.]|uniref:hypothetical protein n=1 Tax=Sedimentibacter sp. TaxID=1960295 RepID=UPI0031590C42